MQQPRVSTLVTLLFLAACGGSDGGGTAPPSVSQVVVSPSTITLTAIGQTLQFAAQALDADGAAVTGVNIGWSSSNSSVVSMSAAGLATAVAAGSTTIRATGGGQTGTASVTVDPAVAMLVKISGDGQAGPEGVVLPEALVVEARDAGGSPMVGEPLGITVTLGGGNVAPSTMTTNSQGRLSISWTLGLPGPQSLSVSSGSVSVTFTANAQPQQSSITILTTSVPDGRRNVLYQKLLEAEGGSGTGFLWEMIGGSLPAGVDLGLETGLQGVPSEEGVFGFTVRVTDSEANEATRSYNLRICPVPLALGAGGMLVLDPVPAGQCGFFLESGAAGDRYRIAVIRPTPVADPNDVITATLTVKGAEVVGSPPPVSAQRLVSSFPRFEFPEAIERDLIIGAATAQVHARMRTSEQELLARLGRDALVPDRSTEVSSLSQSMAVMAPAKRTFNSSADFNTGTCTAGTPIRGILLGENAVMAIYQDSTENANRPANAGVVQQILDYHAAYGKPAVDSYFGGVSDIDGDGQVVVLISPLVTGNTAAFVWGGNFFQTANCPASNQGELIYLNIILIEAVVDAQSPSFQVLATMAHEAKHVSSVFKRLNGQSGNQHALWAEEGTAEIAGEISARLAWADNGGPAVEGVVNGASFQTFDANNWGVVLRLARTIWYLSSQPNAVTHDPVGADPNHFFYGSSWHFHRFLGDAYGGAGDQAQGDAAFFTRQNDPGQTNAAPGGFVQLVGKSFENLMEEFAAAVMLVGTGAPPPTYAFTTYDFVSAAAIFSVPNPVGEYPWTVTTTGTDDDNAVEAASFADGTFSGSIGASGMRIHEFVSNGSGIGASFNVDVSGTAKVVVVRIQ